MSSAVELRQLTQSLSCHSASSDSPPRPRYDL